MRKPVSIICLCLLNLLAVALPAQAQGLFSPAIRVNDATITGYDLQQRVKLLRALGTSGNLDKLAREQLIDDRLKIQAATDAGFTPSLEEIEAGVAEFAARGNLKPDEFLSVLSRQGVARDSFIAFVRTSVAWRSLIRARYGRRASVRESEVDRALGGATGGLRLLLSEIILPGRPEVPGERAKAKSLGAQLSKISSFGGFASAAREYSAVPSKDRGGRLEWMPLNNLPPALRPLLVALKPGEVTQPIETPNAIILFQLRALEETSVKAPEIAAIEFAQYLIPGGRTAETLAEAAKLRGRVDSCDDLYGIAKEQPERLIRETLPPAKIGKDVLLELAKLDTDEISTALTRDQGQNLMVLMLCGRTFAATQDVSRADVRNQLISRQLAGYADGLIAQLRADALIRQ